MAPQWNGVLLQRCLPHKPVGGFGQWGESWEGHLQFRREPLSIAEAQAESMVNHVALIDEKKAHTHPLAFSGNDFDCIVLKAVNLQKRRHADAHQLQPATLRRT